MEELLNFEIKVHLVEELELRIIKVVSSESDFLSYWIDSMYETDYFERYMQGPLLHEYYKYIYTRSKPLNDNEKLNWLTISINQFNTHRPELRKEYLSEKILTAIGPRFSDIPDSKPADLDLFFETIFKSYQNNFHLFKDLTLKAMDDFKKGYLGSFAKLSTQEFPESQKKIKTNLSVPQLAYLFKVLQEVGIITNNNNQEIYAVLKQNFSSKKREDISSNTLKNDFEAPDYATIEFWREKFMQLVQKARKDKEK